MEFFLLALTGPIFYIIGIIAIIKWLFGSKGKNNITQISYLKRKIDDLTLAVRKSPNKKVSDLILDYVKDLEKLTNTKIPLVPVGEPAVSDQVHKPSEEKEESKIIEEKDVDTSSVQKDLSNFWGNWYSDNSISLLLYIGSFLIVASASIYVGFQWETIGGNVKAWMLSLLTLGFFGFGTWFYNVPKIKNAGATFIAIAALLIPFTGLAWHNFVLEPQGYTLGVTWLVTSVISVSAYFILAYSIRHQFYTYISGFGGLSIVLSLVNVTNTNPEFYVLGGIFSAFILLFSARAFGTPNEKTKEAFVTPLSISAHIIMPISLIVGLFFVAQSGQFFSLELAFSGLFASLYYLLAYSFNREIGFLVGSQLLFPLSIFLFGKWLTLDDMVIYISIQIISSAYIIISYYLLKKWKKESGSLFSVSQVVTPLAFLLVGATALSNGDIFSSSVIFSLSMAVAFYTFSYWVKKELTFAYAAEIIFLATIFVFGKWLGFTNIQVFYFLEIIFLLYILVAYYLTIDNQTRSKDLSESLTIVSLSSAAGVFFIGLGTGIDAFHITAFAVFPTVFGLIAAYFSKNSVYFFYNFIFLAISVYLYFNEMLDISDKQYLLGSAYVGISVIFYLITLSVRNIKSSFEAFGFATGMFSVLGIIFTFLNPEFFLISNIVVSAILLDYAIRSKQYEFIYLSNVFIFLGLWTTLRIFDIKVNQFPLFFAGISYLFYLASQVLPDKLNPYYRFTSLVGLGVNTIIFGLMGQNDSAYATHLSTNNNVNQNVTPLESETVSTRQIETSNTMERNALISSYGSFILYSFDSLISKKSSIGYFASAVGMITYLWQMSYLGFAETQVYTLPLGIYFLVLGYLRRVRGDTSNQDILSYIGLGFLLIPTFLQSIGKDGASYGLLLGIEGIIIFAFGNSLKYKTYLYAGVGAIVVAVIAQTYEFVLDLPRWMITAVAGLLFLFTAIYLMLNKKDPPK